jgi:hypothetical protein
MTEPARLEVVQAWSAVMADVRSVGKDSKNNTPGQTYMFRGIDAVMNAAGPAMRAHGVIVTPHRIRSIDYTTVTVGKNQTVMASVRVLVTYRIRGPLGDHIDVTVPGEAFDSGDKGTAKAMSVAYRTMLLQSLTLPTDDPDPDAARSAPDISQEEAQDLGKWRGMVSAAGRDQAKLSALWTQMKAEWDSVPWSPERHAVLLDAVNRAKEPAPAEPARPPAPEHPEPRPDTAELDAQAAADWDAAWREKLAAATEGRKSAEVRALIKLAKEAGAAVLAAEGTAVLDRWRAER